MFARMVQARARPGCGLLMGTTGRSPARCQPGSLLRVELLGCEPGTGWAGGGEMAVGRRDGQEPSAIPHPAMSPSGSAPVPRGWAPPASGECVPQGVPCNGVRTA